MKFDFTESETEAMFLESSIDISRQICSWHVKHKDDWIRVVLDVSPSFKDQS